MLRGLKNAASAMRARQHKMDTIANNIANANTTGFKRKDVLFSDLLYQNIERPGNAVKSQGQKPIVSGAGLQPLAIRTDLRSGYFMETRGKFDFAIVGDGYFRIELPSGEEAYTRDGSFTADGKGNLLTGDGYRVIFPQLPEEECEISVTADGEVTALYANGETKTLGRIELAIFANPHGLSHQEHNLYTATAASGASEAPNTNIQTNLRQGWLESSNVSLTEEMTQLITGQRGFELSARAMRTFDEMLAMANQLRR